MHRRVGSLVIVGVLLAAVAGWVAQGSAAQGTPVASPTSVSNCGALLDFQTTIALMHENTASWEILFEINAGKGGWATKSAASLRAASDEFGGVGAALRSLPLSTDEGKTHAKAMADIYEALSQLTNEMADVESLAEREAIFVAYSQPLNDLGADSVDARNTIKERCGVERLTFDEDGVVVVNGVPMAAPLATPAATPGS